MYPTLPRLESVPKAIQDVSLFPTFKLLVLCVLLSFGSMHGQTPDKASMRLVEFEQAPVASRAMSLSSEILRIDASQDLRHINTQTDRLGFTHERMQQYFQGIKVENSVWTIHKRNGVITSMSGNAAPIQGLNTFAKLSKDEALALALSAVNADRYMWQYFGHRDMYPEGERVIYQGATGKETPRLAYKFDIYAVQPLSRVDMYIDAVSGDVLGKNEKIHDANTPASGTTLYNGTRNFTADFYGTGYRLRQTVSGGGVQTYDLNGGTNYSTAADVTSSTTNFANNPTAVQVHWASEQVYDYFLQDHNRNSYDGNGSILRSYVSYGNNYANAFWDGSRMTYGDGNGTSYGPLVSVDIVGHEITHGVTQNSANLIYQNQSGALNESFSDIFGEAIENFATGTNDWLMGDDITLGSAQPIRNMANPNTRFHPDTYYGTHWYTGSGDNGGVHYNSGVQNKWFYILVNGESGTNDINDSYSVTGIGMDKAADIAYRNLTVYLTPNSNYYDARLGAIQSAIDLFGANTPEVNTTTTNHPSRHQDANLQQINRVNKQDSITAHHRLQPLED